MIIPKDKFKEVKRNLMEGLAANADTVMCERFYTDQRHMEFCFDNYDRQLFYHEHYHDAADYQAFDVRFMLETMILMERHKLQALPFANDIGMRDDGFIDIGKVVNERVQLLSLHRTLPDTDWWYSYSDDYSVRQKGAAQVSRAYDDIEKFSRTQFGLNGADILWSLYAPQEFSRPGCIKDFVPYIPEATDMAAIKSQFKTSGLLRAFTADLKDKLYDGRTHVQHRFEQVYDGDKVNTVLHLAKSASLNKYFLQKFDVDIQKKGLQKNIEYTFHLRIVGNDGHIYKAEDNGYTLAKAYNLLCGRPVRVLPPGHDVNDIPVWESIDFKKVLQDGTFAKKNYEGYTGDKIKAIIDRYAIHEQAGGFTKKQLLKKLEAGNLQSVMFVSKGGHQEKMFVSLNLVSNSLMVLDQYKHPVSTETLLKKHYIKKDWSKRLDTELKTDAQTGQALAGIKPPYFNWQQVEKINHRMRHKR